MNTTSILLVIGITIGHYMLSKENQQNNIGFVVGAWIVAIFAQFG